MRTLLLFRGAPGCGKSTFIQQNGLKQYAICPDDLRILFQSPELDADGKEQISMVNDKKVWEFVFQLLDARMQRGEFTVIDATNSKTAEMNRYKDLAKQYRYRMYIIDMTDLPIEECKTRNKQRDKFKWVPDEAIDKMYSRFATQKVPSGIAVLKPDELHKILYHANDLNGYKKIHIIGDVHGCYTCLKEYLGEMKDDEFYLFCGDYIDRGIENAEVVKFLLTLIEKKNVQLLEGNHERWLNAYGHDVRAKSLEFENHTKYHLFEAGISKNEIRKLYSRFSQCAYFVYGDKGWFVCHAGISSLKQNPLYVATEQMIRGTGKYSEAIKTAEAWEKNTGPQMYQVFGHRNVEGVPVDMGHRCYNLEGGVEFGGYLRCVELTPDGQVKTVETKNNVFMSPEQMKERPEIEQGIKSQMSVADIVSAMRSSKLIVEKKLIDEISSFNFTRDAFYNKAWDDLTCKARGLFINTSENKVVARAYEKFYNINEVVDTRIETLKMKMEFPAVAYIKENGYLGLVSWNVKQNNFFFASKSTNQGDFAENLKKIFYESTSENIREEIANFLKDNDCTMVFEVIDPVNDPHIIKYDKTKLVLLDCVYNALDFKKVPYRDLQYIAKIYKLEVKRQHEVFNNWTEFFAWYSDVDTNDILIDGKHIEGFVIEDNNGFMIKEKLPYYRFWKHMRSVMRSVIRKGYYDKTSALYNATGNYFYGFLRGLREKNPDVLQGNIIAMRDMFYEQMKEKGTRIDD